MVKIFVIHPVSHIHPYLYKKTGHIEGSFSISHAIYV